MEHTANRAYLVQVGYAVMGYGESEQAAYDMAVSEKVEGLPPLEDVSRYVGTASTSDRIGRKLMTQNGELHVGEMVMVDRQGAEKLDFDVSMYD